MPYIINNPDFIVVKHHHYNTDTDSNYNEINPDERLEDDNFFSSDEFKEYIKHHGYHFTEPLAEFAVNRMYSNKWSISQIAQYLKSQNIDINSTIHKVTLADIYYAANMYYSDFYPEAIQSDLKCITAAMLIANDKDGYEGQLFSRWLSDIMRKGVNVDWELYDD